MPTLTCEPRDAGAIDTQSVADLFEEIVRTVHSPEACAQTCTWGWTVACDAASQASCIYVTTSSC